MKYTSFVFLLSLIGCTEKTFIEGLVPVSKKFSLEKNIILISGRPTLISLKIENSNQNIYFNLYKYKANFNTTGSGISVGDSVAIVSVTSTLGIETKSGSVKRFNKDEMTSALNIATVLNIPLFASVKKNPYKSEYVLVKQVDNYVFDFNTKQEGYMAFNCIVNELPVFGWIHIVIDEKKIICKEFGYQTFEACKVGQ